MSFCLLHIVVVIMVVVIAFSHSNLICNQEFSVASNGPGVCVSIKSFWAFGTGLVFLVKLIAPS